MTLLEEYSLLLDEIDDWFKGCQQSHPVDMACASGCSQCCRGLFDITLLDAALLGSGFALLAAEVRGEVSSKSRKRLQTIVSIWPEFCTPFTIKHRPEHEIEELLASDNDTPCPLLDDNRRCLLYDYRPMTCRLHGLPLVALSGEVLENEWCTKNFTGCDPLLLENLRGDFDRLFRKEAALGGYFTKELLGEALHELDTFIPTALLLDFKGFDWSSWFSKYPVRT